MNQLGIDQLSVFGMPPVEMARLAAELGCDCISIVLQPSGSCNPHDYPDWSLRDDAGLRRGFRSALGDCGVRIATVEGFVVEPGKDVRRFAGDLDVLAEFGGERITTISFEPDLPRTIAQYAVLGAMAAQRGLGMSVEVGSRPVASLEASLEAIRQVALPGFTLLVDAMHFFRFGGTVERFAGLDPMLVGYVQLCDVPRVSRFETYMEEAMFERLPPGEGELPLAGFAAAIPAHAVVGLEIPRRSMAAAGVGPAERLRPCVRAARALLGEKARAR